MIIYVYSRSLIEIACTCQNRHLSLVVKLLFRHCGVRLGGARISLTLRYALSFCLELLHLFHVTLLDFSWNLHTSLIL